MKTAAVVIPTYKTSLSQDEQISLRQLLLILPGYDIFYVAPDGLQIGYQKFPTISFSPKYFVSADAYSELLVKKEFYLAFKEYEYILLYQLDCLVFSDQLLKWCAKGYDYIGAPWLSGHGSGYNQAGDAVGNGGFSLRKTSSFLDVLERKEKMKWADFKKMLAGILSFKSQPTFRAWLARAAKAWRSAPFFGHFLTEDYFWSFEAKNYKPDFNIAPVEQALQFAFETDPRYCFERTHGQLPFGCHAWGKWDRQFWVNQLSKPLN